MNFDVQLLSLDAAPGHDPIEGLVQVFRLDHRRAEQLLRRLPYVVKRGVSRDQATRVVELLRSIGGNAEMFPSSYGEAIEGSLVAPLPLEPPPRFKPQTPGDEHAVMPAQPAYVAPDVRDPFRNAASKQLDPSGARQGVRAQQPVTSAARASQVQPPSSRGPQPGARAQAPGGQARAQQGMPAPAARATTSHKHPARPARPNSETLDRESDGFEADISAVLPPSFPPPKTGSFRPVPQQRAPSLRPAPVQSRAQPGHPSAADAGRASMYGAPTQSPDGRASLYGAPGGPSQEARASIYGSQDGRTSSYGAPQAFRDNAPAGATGRAVATAQQVSDSPMQRAPVYGNASDAELLAQAQRAFTSAASPVDPLSSSSGLNSPNTGAFRAMQEAAPAFASAPTGSYRATSEPEPAATSLRSPPSADNTQTVAVFPTLAIHGAPVTAKHQVVPGTTNAVGWSVVLVGCLGLLSLAVAVLVYEGYALAIVLFALVCTDVLLGLHAHQVARATGVPVGQGQLPEIYACVKQFSLRLDMAEVPSTYVTRNSIKGARARRKFKRLALELDEAFVMELVASSRPEALSFFIARELSRHALNHTHPFRRLLALINPWLSRRDVLSADAAATALVVDRNIARSALIALLARSSLARHIDPDEVERIAVSLRRDGSAWTLFAPERCVLARLDAFVRGYR